MVRVLYFRMMQLFFKWLTFGGGKRTPFLARDVSRRTLWI